jgi:hypothetical protein
MKILTLNIGRKGSWALYNSTSCDSITWGKFTYKKDPMEKKEGPLRRFKNILDDKNYHNDNINKVYYNFCDKEKEPRKEFAEVMRKFCEDKNITCDKIEYKVDDLLIAKKTHCTIEDDIEAGAVAMINLAKKQVAK